jgi:hypothetical protein
MVITSTMQPFSAAVLLYTFTAAACILKVHYALCVSVRADLSLSHLLLLLLSLLLQVGDAQSRRADGNGSNIYATLLSPEKIEQLEVCTSTNTAC